MLFNSFPFLVFFVLVTGLYYILPHKLRWFMLLTASCIFYMYFVPIYILILFGTIVVDYFAGILIENSKSQKQRKMFLVLSLFANIGVLGYFKYYNFFIGNFNSLAAAIDWNYSLDTLKFILPIGLSFHTFQAMSYTIEVYRGNQPAERHFGIYALYVMYYPQLVAGPIERPQNVLPQFHKYHKFEYGNLISGLKQMLIGFFKKMVIADNLADYVNPVYNHPHDYQGITILLTAILFAFEIYCDFSGYSDIALGASRTMGIELMQNFRAPFLSESITEFWRRWHISLSTWFNDYVFTPFITHRRDWGNLAIITGLFMTFFLSGLWHGAGWNFAIYGALHGIALIYEFQTKKKRKKLFSKLPKWLNSGLSMILTFLYVAFSWLFFRATNISDSLFMAKEMILGIPQYLSNLSTPGYLWLEPLIFEKTLALHLYKFVFLFVALCLLFIGDAIDYKGNLIKHLDSRRFVVRWVYYGVLVYMILLFGVFHSEQEFIYFQF